jgi:hypothetical protein
MGTEFWMKALEKEMKNIEPAFEFWDDDLTTVAGYQHIDCHMIFDMKITLKQKVQYVAGGHQTEHTKEVTFASILTRDSIRIASLSLH